MSLESGASTVRRDAGDHTVAAHAGGDGAFSAADRNPSKTQFDSALTAGGNTAQEALPSLRLVDATAAESTRGADKQKPNAGKPSEETILPDGASFQKWSNGETSTNYWNNAQGVVHTWPNGETETEKGHEGIDTVVHTWTNGETETEKDHTVVHKWPDGSSTQTIPDGGGLHVTTLNPDGSGKEVSTGQHSSFSDQPVTRPHPDEMDNGTNIYGPGGELIQSTIWSSVTGTGSIETPGPNGQMISRPAQIGLDGQEIIRPGGTTSDQFH